MPCGERRLREKMLALIQFWNISPTLFEQLSPDWQSLVKQANGWMANAWARLAANVGDTDATLILEREWGHGIPKEVIKAGLLRT